MALVTLAMIFSADDGCDDDEPGDDAPGQCAGADSPATAAFLDGPRHHHADGAEAQWRPGNALGQELSAALFRRDGAVRRIDVEVESDRLR